MKSTKVQNPRCNKCSTVVEKKCLAVESYRTVSGRFSFPFVFVLANEWRLQLENFLYALNINGKYLLWFLVH